MPDHPAGPGSGDTSHVLPPGSVGRAGHAAARGVQWLRAQTETQRLQALVAPIALGSVTRTDAADAPRGALGTPAGHRCK